ncbi:FK/GFPP [Ectocarpus sp. CCAP 1310/34]|nr:FK/GFPP [Ectocarpus sp. CCAP 1310/34]
MADTSEPILAEDAGAANQARGACCHQRCLVPEGFSFDCLAITAPNPRASKAYLDELVHRVGMSGTEGTKEVLILAVSDPEGVRIGSGGGTLNAVLEIDQALRAAQLSNDSQDPQGLAAARVLLVHSGGDSQRSPTQCVCGKAWSALNSCGDSGSGRCNTPMDLLLEHLSRLFSGGSSGSLEPGTLVVTACDVMLLIPPEVAATADWSFDNQSGAAGGVAGLAIAADAAKYASHHGVYCLDGGGGGGGQKSHGIKGVRKYLQKPSREEAETSGAFINPGSMVTPNNESGNPNHDPNANPEVAIDSGVVVFSGAATWALTSLALSETFKGCTSRGVAGGASALRLELYSDILLALRTGGATGESAEGMLDAYLEACGPVLPPDHDVSKARREIWDALSGFPLGALLLQGAKFVHLGTTPELMEMLTLRLPEFIEPYGLTARASSVVGAACSVENDPPAVVVNSSLHGAGVVAGGAVIEHCYFDRDGWEIGAGSLISGIRSLGEDCHLRLRGGMCLQQTDLDRASPEEPASRFVVSLFGTRDDIKAHYSAERARVCGATWEAFFGYTGATVEDLWGGIEEGDRKLWSARLFPVLTRIQGQAAGTSSTSINTVMWMQDVQEHAAAAAVATACPSSSPPGGDVSSPPISGDRGGGIAATKPVAVKNWLAAERLSFKEILAKANPGAEFRWRRHLEEGMAAKVPAAGAQAAAPVGSGRGRAWDAVAVVAPALSHLPEARRWLDSLAGRGAMAAFCVPPPRPCDTPDRRMDRDGPLVLNALLVVAERYSALKRARFGSDTSAEALRGMCVLLCVEGVSEEKKNWDEIVEDGVPGACDLDCAAQAGVWVLQRDGSMFLLREESLAPLLELPQRLSQYQGLTYLDVDNAIPVPETVPPGSPTGTTSALEFLAAATAAARTPSPEPVQRSAVTEPRSRVHSGDLRPDHAASSPASAGTAAAVTSALAGLTELDERAKDEGCTPAGAAQALARVACRLYELADILGGGGHRSGPGENPEWQAAMRGLDTLRPLPDGNGWGPPAALPASVAALKCRRDLWLGSAGGPPARDASQTLPQKRSTIGGTQAASFSHVEPHLVVRCARHYERAAAVVVSAAVRTASLFVELPPARWGLGSGANKESQAMPSAGGATGGDFANEKCGGSDVVDSVSGGTGDDAGPTLEDKEQQRQLLEERISRMNPRDQALARHSQVHVNHRTIATKNAELTQRRVQEERRRWQQAPEESQQQALPVGACITSRAAARVDLAGGWTDTPPISYEAGGAVLNAAVTVSGEKPIEARCERIEAARVELVCVGREGTMTSRTVCSSLEDFSDFCVPHAPAALLKAALICAGIVPFPTAASSDGNRTAANADAEDSHASAVSTAGDPDCKQGSSLLSLEKQLAIVFGCGGIRITSRSGLPQGSGMGTSSILAGVVLSVVCVAAGRAMSPTSLVHAVLRVEQLMTAGLQSVGDDYSWDQVGGLLGGVKICRTSASLPLQGLVSNAEDAANACRGAGDLEALGRCLSTYWVQKKRMAPGNGW